MEEVREYIDDYGWYDLYEIRHRVRDYLDYCGKEWLEISSERYGDNWVEIKIKLFKGDDFSIELNEGALVSNEEIHRAIPELIDNYFKQKEKGEDMREIKRFKPDDNGEAFRRKLSNKIHLIKGYTMGATEICALVREGDEPRADAVFVVISEQCDEIIKMLEGVWGDNT